MKEGQITHEEVNAAIAAAQKTILFGGQHRPRAADLRSADQRLPRLHVGHDRVRFFYNAVRQLPEYFLDALLARNVSVTLVMGPGLLCFKDLRNHQAVHIGRARRTIYLPEQLLEQTFANGYDYWSITQVLIAEGWKLLDFALLSAMATAGLRRQRTHHTEMGHNAFRDLLRHENRHRSSYESPALKERCAQWGMQAPPNELGEFIALYEAPFRKLTHPRARASSPLAADQVAKALYDEYQEELWASRKVEELADELNFPSLFLLDRDVVHPLARQLAEAAGQETAPRNIGEARHDYRDALRFDQGPEMAIEGLIGQAVRFGPDGIAGLMEEIAAAFLDQGKIDETLADWARRTLAPLASKPKHLYIYLERGLTLARFRALMVFFGQVRSGERALHPEDLDSLRSLMIGLAATKAGPGDTTQNQVLSSILKVDALFIQLKVLLAREATRLLDHPVSVEQIEPPAVLADTGAEFDKAVARVALCLDLVPGYPELVRDLLRRGPQTARVLEEFIAGAAADPEQQIAVLNASQALEAGGWQAGGGAAAMHPDQEILGDLVERVNRVVALLPERLHLSTSGGATAVRRPMKEFEQLCRSYPTAPDQLAWLAMVLVRLDRAPNYEALLDQVRWMGPYAVGTRLALREKTATGRKVTKVSYSPGLLRVIDEEGWESGEVARRAAELVRELAGEEALEPLRGGQRENR